MAKISDKEADHLFFLGKIGIATPIHVNAVFCSRKSKTQMYTFLHDYCERKLVQKVTFRDPSQHAGGPHVAYKLTSSGMRTLKRLGRSKNGEITRPSSITLCKAAPTFHALRSNEAIIFALELVKIERQTIKKLTRQNPHLPIDRPPLTVHFESEPFLREHPIERATDKTIPDAFVMIRQGEREAGIIFEYDRASVSMERIKARMYEYISLDDTYELEHRLGVRVVRVCWITESVKRQDELMSWARDVIDHQKNPGEFTDLFAFGVYEGDYPMTFYFQPIWKLLGGQTIPLLPIEWRKDGWFPKLS